MLMACSSEQEGCHYLWSCLQGRCALEDAAGHTAVHGRGSGLRGTCHHRALPEGTASSYQASRHAAARVTCIGVCTLLNMLGALPLTA